MPDDTATEVDVLAEMGQMLMKLAPRVSHLQRETLNQLEPPMGITQYGVLARLGTGVTSMAELRARSAVTFSTLSEATSALVRQGLVDRVRSEQDRRSIDLSLTEEGRHALDVAQTAMEELQDRLVEGLPAPDPNDLERFWHPVSGRVRQLLAEEGQRDGFVDGA